MIRLARVLKDYADSGALNALVPIHAVIGDGIFLTKAGDLAMFLATEGADDECLDPEQLDATARRFEASLRQLDERFRLYQYVIKRRHPELAAEASNNKVSNEASVKRLAYLKHQDLYLFETYWAVVYEGARPRGNSRTRLKAALAHPWTAMCQGLSADQAASALKKDLEDSRELLIGKVEALAVQWRDLMSVRILDTEQGYGLLRRLLNYDPVKAEAVKLNYTRFVDFQACDSQLECHADALRLDGYFVQVLTLKVPPARTHAGMLRGLFDLSAPYILATEWRREDPMKVRRLIQSKRRHFHNKKASLLNYFSASDGAPKDILIDDSAVAFVADLGACLEEIEVHGRAFGEFSLTVVLYDEDAARLRRSVARCVKTFGAVDAQIIEERYNRLNAWLAAHPGNSAFNLRRIWLLDTNYADFSLLFTVAGGSVRNAHLGAEYLAILEGRGGRPYYLNLHSQDVAHTLVLGATGAGKSFLLNFLITHLQKYQPFTCIFDLSGSYRSLTRALGGAYLDVAGQARSFTINPFSLKPTKENLLFLYGFVKVLIESNGFRMSAEEERDLYEQIENLYAVDPSQRRLFTLANILSRNLRRQLQKWVEGGPYAGLFDNADDNLTLARFQTVDFEGMEKAPDQLEPLLFYVLHRATDALATDQASSVLKATFVMDEAWQFFSHPVIKAYVTEALKTWRKKNAAMILATQSSDDLLASEMLPVVVESCPTKLFLANPGMDREACRRLFHLNETETELITRLVPKQQILLKQPQHAKVLKLAVDPEEYEIYSNASSDRMRRQENAWRGMQEPAAN